MNLYLCLKTQKRRISSNLRWIMKPSLSFCKYVKRQTQENWTLYTTERNLSTLKTDSARVKFENEICRESFFMLRWSNKSWFIETVIRDLGVLFQDDLKFGEHIHKMTAKANSKLGVIRNTFHELNKENFIKHMFDRY